MKILHLVTAAILLTTSAIAGAADDPDDPQKAVQAATDELLNKLAEVKPLYKSDQAKFYSEVRASLGPFIDFDGFSRGVMAKYYRRATDEQKERFSATFETQLIETYANALVEFDNQKIEVLPPTSKPADGRATIEINIHGSGGKIFPVVYSLAYVDERWKLRNVIIEGINIGYQFRSQFSNYMQQYRNNIDQVIDNWNVDVAKS